MSCQSPYNYNGNNNYILKLKSIGVEEDTHVQLCTGKFLPRRDSTVHKLHMNLPGLSIISHSALAVLLLLFSEARLWATNSWYMKDMVTWWAEAEKTHLLAVESTHFLILVNVVVIKMQK